MQQHERFVSLSSKQRSLSERKHTHIHTHTIQKKFKGQHILVSIVNVMKALKPHHRSAYHVISCTSQDK